MNRFVKISLAIVLAGAVTSNCMAKVSLNKTYDKDFGVTNSTALMVQSRYGQINVESWDKNYISIHVEVVVEHSDSIRAKALLNAVNIMLKQDGSKVSAITEYTPIEQSRRGRWFIWRSESQSDEQKLSINYSIKMPSNVRTNIDHRYGNIGIDRLTGDVLIDHKYGNINIDELTGLVRIDLKYGNIKINKLTRGDSNDISSMVLGYAHAQVGELGWLNVDMKYGSFEVERAKAMVFDSKYSKVKVQSISSMVVESKYDTYNIGSISNLVGDMAYTNLTASKLSNKLKIISKYGSINVNEVADGFESISLDGAYTGIKVGISPKASYVIDGASSYASIKYTAPAKRLNRIEGRNSTTISGIVGAAENPRAKVYVRTRYGNVKLDR